MKFFLLAVVFFCIVSALIVTVAAFVMWDKRMFNISTWEPAGRFFMIIISLFVSVGLAGEVS